MNNEENLKKQVKLAMDKYQKTGKEKYSDVYIKEADRHTMQNYEEIIKSTACTCMYCGYQFDPVKPPEPLSFMTERDGNKTLQCPMCSIDSVIGNASGYPVTDIYFIARCTREWFSSYSRLDDKGYPVEKINWIGINVD